MPTLVGVDSYSYPGCSARYGAAGRRRCTCSREASTSSPGAAARARLRALQTSFPATLRVPPAAFPAEAYDVALGPRGALEGPEFGERRRPREPRVAPRGGSSLPVMRIVAGPAHRRETPGPGRPAPEACAAARVTASARAPNHGHLTRASSSLLEQVGDLRLCFDTANALRVGDDVADAARQFSGRIEILHLKDCTGTWADPVAGPVSVPLGHGVIPVDEVLDACPDALACIELGQLAPGAGERALVGTYVEYLRRR
jgi:hypothetical protein